MSKDIDKDEEIVNITQTLLEQYRAETHHWLNLRSRSASFSWRRRPFILCLFGGACTHDVPLGPFGELEGEPTVIGMHGRLYVRKALPFAFGGTPIPNEARNWQMMRMDDLDGVGAQIPWEDPSPEVPCYLFFVRQSEWPRPEITLPRQHPWESETLRTLKTAIEVFRLNALFHVDRYLNDPQP